MKKENVVLSINPAKISDLEMLKNYLNKEYTIKHITASHVSVAPSSISSNLTISRGLVIYILEKQIV